MLTTLHASFVSRLTQPQIESQNIVSFMPVDSTSEDSINTVLSHIDNMMQYGEDEEPKVRTSTRGIRDTLLTLQMPRDMDEGEGGDEEQ